MYLIFLPNKTIVLNCFLFLWMNMDIDEKLRQNSAEIPTFHLYKQQKAAF